MKCHLFMPCPNMFHLGKTGPSAGACWWVRFLGGLSWLCGGPQGGSCWTVEFKRARGVLRTCCTRGRAGRAGRALCRWTSIVRANRVSPKACQWRARQRVRLAVVLAIRPGGGGSQGGGGGLLEHHAIPSLHQLLMGVTCGALVGWLSPKRCRITGRGTNCPTVPVVYGAPTGDG